MTKLLAKITITVDGDTEPIVGGEHDGDERVVGSPNVMVGISDFIGPPENADAFAKHVLVGLVECWDDVPIDCIEVPDEL